MKNLGLASKIILIVASSVSLILLAVFSYLAVSNRNKDINTAYSNSASIAEQNASRIKTELEATLIATRTMTQALSTYETFPVEDRRQICDDILYKIVEENSNILSAWVCFEPNALDGLDAKYANTSTSDETGRYLPCFTRADGKIDFYVLSTYDDKEQNDYITIAAESGTEAIMEPTEYTVQGQTILMTDFCIPIKNAAGTIVGVAGLDVTMESLNSMDFNSGDYSSGKVSLLSNGGLYVINNNQEAIGKPISDVLSDGTMAEGIQNAAKSGNTYVAVGDAENSGEKRLITMVPVKLGDTVTPWSSGYSVAMSEITAQSNANMLLLVILFLVVIAAIVIAIRFSIVKLIKRPLADLVTVTEKQVEGDFTSNIQTNRRDELGVLFTSLNIVNNKMNDFLLDLKRASDQVAAGAKQIADSSISLSQGATEQASSIEQLTASTEEVSSQTNLNAENANRANTLAESTKTYAESGNKQMRVLLQAMKDLNTSSGNISNIIKVIDDIAFQTNILALNAAVEAARAGQHGKGFAVVAEEVRNLAVKSADAAKEIAEMIETSIQKTNNGSDIANETATALTSIVTEVNMLSGLVQEIAVASNEQASAIAQINSGIVQVSQVVQGNSSAAQQSAAASEELSGQADSMQEEISYFKLRENASDLSESTVSQQQEIRDQELNG